MEEDIKILKDFINYYEAEATSRKFRGTLSIIVSEDDIQAIENILNRLEQDEKVIEEMAKAWKQDDIRGIEEIIDHFRKKRE